MTFVVVSLYLKYTIKLAPKAMRQMWSASTLTDLQFGCKSMCMQLTVLELWQSKPGKKLDRGCVTFAFRDESHQMLRIIYFGKHCTCHIQGECIVVGRFWKPYIGQAIGGDLDFMVLVSRA
jgi:hypothetical protein